MANKKIQNNSYNLLLKDTLTVFNNVMSRNSKVLDPPVINLKDYMIGDMQAINASLEYMESFYELLFKELKPQAQSLMTEDFQYKLIDAMEKVQGIMATQNFNKYFEIRNTEIQGKFGGLDIFLHNDIELLGFETNKNVMLKGDDVNDQSRIIKIKKVGIQIGKILVRFFHLNICLLFIFYFVANPGILVLIVPFVLFSFVLTQESRPTIRTWSFMFTLIYFFVVAKYLLFILVDANDNSTRSYYLVLINNSDNFWTILKEAGIEKNSVTQLENVYEAFIRVFFIKKKSLNEELDFPSPQPLLQIPKDPSNDEFPSNSNSESSESEQKSENQEEEKQELLSDENLKENSEIQTFSKNGQSKFLKKESYVSDLDCISQPRIVETLKNKLMQSFHYQHEIKRQDEISFLFYELFSKFVLPFIQDKKPGQDLYPITALIQFLIAFYIFFCFTFFGNPDQNTSLLNEVSFNHFSGEMVLFLIGHILLMLIDRIISLFTPAQSKSSVEVKENHRKTSIVFKFCLQVFELALIFLCIGMIFPLKGKFKLQYLCIVDSNRNNTCFYIIYNGFLIGFYLLYCLYFFVAAIQLKFGFKKFKKRNTLLSEYNLFNYTCFLIYRAIPFIFEMKTILDWTIKKTSLSLFQWLKLEDIHAKLYAAKMEAIARKDKEVGEKMDLISKFFLGICLLFILLVLIFGPMLIFSSLNPSTKLNYVSDGDLELGIKINEVNYFKIFTTSHVGQINSISSQVYKSKNMTSNAMLNAIGQNRMQVMNLNSVH